MPPSPVPPAKLAGDSRQIQALPKGYGLYLDEPQSLNNLPGQAPVARSAHSLSLLQISLLHPRESASSNRRKANPADHGHDRMPSPSDRSDPALIPGCATFP